MDPRAGLDRCGKSRPSEVLIASFKCFVRNNMNRLKDINASFGQLVVQSDGDARRKAK